MRAVNFVICALSLLISASPAGAVFIGGKDWRQVTDTVNLSHNDLNAIYDASTGELDTAVTTIGAVDFAGWIWASEAEVAAMLSTFGAFTLGTNDSVSEFDSTSIASIFGVFAYTFNGVSITEDGPYQALRGFTRDLAAGDAQYTAVSDYLTPGTLDGILNNYTAPTNRAYGSYGHFMYRAPSPDSASVSEPAVMILIGIGLLGFAAVRRSKRSVH